MSVGRVVSGCLATATVAGCALLVVGMARADAGKQAAAAPATAPVAEPTTRIPAQLPGPSSIAATQRADLHAPAAVTATSRAATSTSRSVVATPAATLRPASSTTAARATAHPSTTPHPMSTHPATHVVTGVVPNRPTKTATPAHTVTTTTPPKTTTHAAPKRGVALPLRYSTGSATRVITVVAHSTRSTTATLQAWHKAPGGGWLKSGSAMTAHVGSDGLSKSPSESRSATPIGSFTLTRAFGRNSDPGTRLPYFKTTPADWWISQSGRLYNTHQHCSSSCPFNQGSPNEHLYYETPYYNYAVVIDYNTRNAPGGVRQGAGSAFFLHVTDGNPTAGCVSIPQSRLIPIMRWLTPATHPRILIGTA